MSEYQYYEFLAIDRPLTTEETNTLRALSTRAEITPVSFVNHYNWGDFKGDPERLIERYFDVHVYVANWMTAVFMVRLPLETLSPKTVKAMEVTYMLDFKATQSHWIITWYLEESENYDRFGMESGSGWMVRLAPLREELLRGDLRSLYIGWLASVSRGSIDNNEKEPLSINGLGHLTSSQQALAQFLDVDPDLLEGAGIDSPADETEEISRDEIDVWVDELPVNELKSVMKQLLEGKGLHAERTLKNKFSTWRKNLQGEKAEAPRRTVKRGSGLAYDEVCRSIVDISEAHARLGNRKRFEQELKKFMSDHMRRRALVQRLVKAGIWKEQ